MGVVVRRAMVEDAGEIARLNLAFNDLRTSPERIADFIANHAQFETPFVAELDGRVVGMACLRLLPCLCDPTPYAELTELYVEPDAQRRGVGRALVRRIEEEARAGGAAEVVLLTAWRNTRAHAFYHALGYGLYCINMRRSLADPAPEALAGSGGGAVPART